MMDLQAVLEAQLNDSGCGFSIGSFGAVAEFFRREDEPASIDFNNGLTVSTDRGAIRICLHEDVQAVAYETLSSRKNYWLHGLALCMPTASGESHCRTSVTELGHDVDAIRSDGRNDLLFDMGLGAPNVDFCVRTSDPDLIETLRQAVGKSLLAGDSDTMASIIHASPHRVAVSNLGRVEVYQAIGYKRTPEGPHTHVLPKLLRAGRTHDAKVPIPSGYLPCVNVYPASPLFDTLGEPRAYDRTSHLAFEALLQQWGADEYVRQKAMIAKAIREELEPASFSMPKNRLRRSAVRIALRQLAFDHALSDQASRWRGYFDPAH